VESKIGWIAALAVVAGLTVSCGSTTSVKASSVSPVQQLPAAFHGSGNARTGTFTVAAGWYVAWAYDCRDGLAKDGVIPSGASCTFTIKVKLPDGSASALSPFENVGTEGQGVLRYRGAGTFYVDLGICCAKNTWTLKVGQT
jgi:hypothetical protein